MKYILKIFSLLGHLWHILCPPAMVNIAKRIANRLYTGYWCTNFAKWGKNSVIMHSIFHIKGEKYISVGESNVFEPGLQLTAWEQPDQKPPRITIGNHCTFRAYAHITAVNEIVIGDNLLTGTNVLITDNAHGQFLLEQLKMPPAERPIVSSGSVHIGNDVWLGNNVCIMPGVTIGDGSIIAAQAVVTHDIPPYSMAAGIPAKIIKKSTSNE